MTTDIPVIVYNGAFILNANTGEILSSLYFSSNEKENDGITRYLDLRKGDKVISFGDAINDIPMFLISDECYTVGNAVDELKNVATGIIVSNDIIKSEIHELFYNHEILSEEDNEHKYQSLQQPKWIIDPIDGTVGYANDQY